MRASGVADAAEDADDAGGPEVGGPGLGPFVVLLGERLDDVVGAEVIAADEAVAEKAGVVGSVPEDTPERLCFKGGSRAVAVGAAGTSVGAAVAGAASVGATVAGTASVGWGAWVAVGVAAGPQAARTVAVRNVKETSCGPWMSVSMVATKCNPAPLEIQKWYQSSLTPVPPSATTAW